MSAGVALTVLKAEKSFHNQCKATIDTLGVTFPFEQSELAYNRPLKLPSGATLVTYCKHARLEGCVAKAARGSNVVGLPLSEAVEVLDHFLADALEHFDEYTRHVTKMDDLSVTRLDLAREFRGVRRIPMFLTALGNRPQGRRLGTRLHIGTSSGVPETLTVGNKSGKARLYDKYVESKGEALPGHLRFEAELRKRALTGRWAAHHGGQVHQVRDLWNADLTALCRGMFEYVGFNDEVASTETFVQAVKQSDLSRNEKMGVLAHVFLSENESAPTRRKYNALMRDHQIPLASSEVAERFIGRLDFDRGMEVYVDEMAGGVSLCAELTSVKGVGNAS